MLFRSKVAFCDVLPTCCLTKRIPSQAIQPLDLITEEYEASRRHGTVGKIEKLQNKKDLSRCLARDLGDMVSAILMLSVHAFRSFNAVVCLSTFQVLSTHVRGPHLPTYSSIVFTHSHLPLRFSFHSVTLLSPALTANTFPLKLQLTLHSTTSKLITLLFHTPG